KILDKKQKEIAVVPEISKTLSKKTWKLKELYQAGFAVAIEAEKITLEFDLENRRFSGQAPCNRYFGGINLLTKTGLLPGPVASTRRACGRSEDNVLETQYFEAFGLINQYQMDEKQLKLFQESQLVLVFE
ncbi:MAG: META domain-containing protein, partial [Saprospiraceae bacterium]